MKRSSQLHVGYLVQQFPPEVGAGPARVTEMARRWQEAGARVTVVTGLPGRAIPGRAYGSGDPAYRGKLFMAEEWEGIRVLRSWLYPTTRPGFSRTVLNNVSFMATSAAHALARMGRADVLIASSPPLFPHVAGAAVGRMRGIPLVVEVRDLWPDYLVGMGMLREGHPATRALFALERRLLTRADHVVAVTESFRRRIIGKGVAPERVDVIPNGVDVELYYASDEPPPLPALERRDGEFVAGYLGTFGAGQQLGTLVDAAAILQREDPAIRIVLAGDGLDRERVSARAEALGVTNLSIHPPIPKDRTRAFYNRCDACLVPLAPIPVFQETIPSKIFEVMACERPVLASLSGEGKAIVERSGGGVVAPPGDARGIADALRALKAMPAEERAALGRRGREFVTREYAREALADRYLEILTDVASRPRRAPSLSSRPS